MASISNIVASSSDMIVNSIDKIANYSGQQEYCNIAANSIDVAR